MIIKYDATVNFSYNDKIHLWTTASSMMLKLSCFSYNDNISLIIIIIFISFLLLTYNHTLFVYHSDSTALSMILHLAQDNNIIVVIFTIFFIFYFLLLLKQ